MDSVDFGYWGPILEEIGFVVIAAFILERALAVPFEWGAIHDFLKCWKLRLPIAYLVAYVIAVEAKLDLVEVLAKASDPKATSQNIGVIVTAAVIAGGSKGAILLFQGVLGFGRDAVAARIAFRDLQAKGQVSSSDARAPSSGPSGAALRDEKSGVVSQPWWR